MAERGAGSREEWFARLRERFLDLARRRVPDDAAEDLVQEALRIIHEKSADDDEPRLAWCFQVLRNVIGNFYQRRRTRAAADSEEAQAAVAADVPRPSPLEALEARESERMIGEAVNELAATDGNCGRYLRGLLAGLDPATIARGDDITAPVLYRRLYRCRGKLRAILERRGVLT